MKKLAALLLVMAMVLGLAACGEKPEETKATDPKSTEKQQDQPTTPGGETQAQPTEAEPSKSAGQLFYEEHKGGDFAFDYGGIYDYADINMKTGNTVYCWSMQCFENPLCVDFNGDIQPGVCEYTYTEGEGGKMLLKLWVAPNKFFSNGDPVDIYDVVASETRAFKNVKNMKVSAENLESIEPVVAEEEIGGEKKMVATYTFLDHKSTNLQYLSAPQPWAGVMPKETCDKYPDSNIEDWHEAIGCFVYMLDEYEPGVSVRMVPNPYYVPRDNDLTGLAGPLYPYFDSMTCYVIADEATAAMMMMSNELDEYDVEASYKETLASFGFTDKVPDGFKGTQHTVFCFNMMNKKMAVAEDPNLRKAIIAACDYEAYTTLAAAEASDDYDLSLVNGAYYGLGILEAADFYSTKADVATAQAYLAKSNFKAGDKVYMIGEGGSDSALLFQDQMNRAGITCELYNPPGATVLDDLYAYAADYDYDLARVSSGAGNFNPNEMVQNIKSRFWINERKDAILAEIATLPNGDAKSIDLYKEFLNLMVQDCGVYPVVRHNSLTYCHSDLAPVKMNAQGNCKVGYYWAQNAADHVKAK